MRQDGKSKTYNVRKTDAYHVCKRLPAGSFGQSFVPLCVGRHCTGRHPGDLGHDHGHRVLQEIKVHLLCFHFQIGSLVHGRVATHDK